MIAAFPSHLIYFIFVYSPHHIYQNGAGLPKTFLMLDQRTAQGNGSSILDVFAD
jgi:hypothetical protein